MDFLLFTSIISILLISAIGVIALIKNPKSRTNQLFGLYCFFVTLCAIATYFSLVSPVRMEILIWARVVMAFATAQSVSMLLFILSFPSKIFVINKKILAFIILAGLVTFIICLTSWVFSNIRLDEIGHVQQTITAPGIIVFIIITLGSAFSSIVLSYKKFIQSKGILRIQFQYIFFGLVIMYTGIVFFSFILPVVFQNANYIYLYSLFTLPFAFFCSYIIFRYRFLDIHVILRKGLIYGVSLITSLAVYTYLALTLKITIEESWDVSPGITAAMLIILVALGFPPLKMLVEKSINTLFKGRKSIDLAVKELREQVSQKKDLDALVELVVNNVTKYLEVDWVKFFIISHRDHTYIFEGDGESEKIQPNNELVRYFEKYSDVLVRDEIPHLMEEKDGKFEKEMLQKVEKEMKKLDASLALPFKTEDELYAVTFLGNRREGSAYSVQDVEYLVQLREQVNFTLASAVLYRDAMERIRVQTGQVI